MKKFTKKIYGKKFAEVFFNFFGAQAPNIYLKFFPGRLDLSTVLIWARYDACSSITHQKTKKLPKKNFRADGRKIFGRMDGKFHMPLLGEFGQTSQDLYRNPLWIAVSPGRLSKFFEKWRVPFSGKCIWRIASMMIWWYDNMIVWFGVFW